MHRRYLVERRIGDDDVPCYSCSSADCGCKREREYQFNETIHSQCFTDEKRTAADGTVSYLTWLLTTDRCYTDVSHLLDEPENGT